jgi:hypothetical protein
MKTRVLWKTALLGSQHLLVLPVSPHMVVGQLEGHGLVDIGVVIQSPGTDPEDEAWRERNGRRLNFAGLAQHLVDKPSANGMTAVDDRTSLESGTTDVLASRRAYESIRS